MATPLAPSNIFPIDPSLAAISRLSESACSYVAHKMSQLAAQPYRGSVGSSRPSTAESAAVPDIQSEIQALTARVAMLQQQLAGPDAELQQLAGKVAALEKVPLRTHARTIRRTTAHTRGSPPCVSRSGYRRGAVTAGRGGIDINEDGLLRLMRQVCWRGVAHQGRRKAVDTVRRHRSSREVRVGANRQAAGSEHARLLHGVERSSALSNE